MALDGAFIHKLVAELSEANGAHIDKIHQPSREELVILLRKPAFTKRLLLSAGSGSMGVYFSDVKYDNPATPPMFCMLMRKFLSGGRITNITSPDLERIIKIDISSVNEMGDIITPCLIIELITGSANIILVDENSKIIDAVHRSQLENGGRIIHPGALYQPPTPLEKLNPITTPINDILDKIYENDMPLDRAILNTVQGFSPLICREISFLTTGDTVFQTSALTGYHKNMLREKLEKIIAEIDINGVPTLLLDKHENIVDFSFTEIQQYGSGYKNERVDSFSALLELFYLRRRDKAHLKAEAQDILKLLTNLTARATKRISLRQKDLKNCENREQLRIYGELLKANLYNITPGQTFAEVQNYYDENLATVRIPLNPALTPAANAAKYFKDYKKTYTAQQTLTSLIENDRRELEYFDSVFDSLSRAQTPAEIREIREELQDEGYIKHAPTKKKTSRQDKFLEFVSPGGYRVLAGKNNRQNDRLTLSVAGKSDIWFHAKNVPGSHVILFCEGQTPADADIIFAAIVAAKNSKAAFSSRVAVDYSPVKFVKKPAGAKPGMVIYSTNKTVFVTPPDNQK